MITFTTEPFMKELPVYVSLSQRSDGSVMVQMRDSTGYTWSVLAFEANGTFTRIGGVNLKGLRLDGSLRIQEHS